MQLSYLKLMLRNFKDKFDNGVIAYACSLMKSGLPT